MVNYYYFHLICETSNAVSKVLINITQKYNMIFKTERQHNIEFDTKCAIHSIL